jgi:hypothetical protein
LRDRDLWGSDAAENDSNKPWYASWAWYQKWSDTEAYIGPLPLDFWHNADLVVMGAAYVAGRGEIDWTLLTFYAIALPSKWLFYHILLMRHPVDELRQYLRERLARE